MVEEEVWTVILLADRVFGRDLHHIEAGNLEFESARSAFVWRDDARHLERGLLRQLDCGFPYRLVDLGTEDHALQIAKAVAQDDEAQFALFPPVVDPSSYGHFLVGMLGEISDRNRGARHDFPPVADCTRRSAMTIA